MYIDCRDFGSMLCFRYVALPFVSEITHAVPVSSHSYCQLVWPLLPIIASTSECFVSYKHPVGLCVFE